MEESIESVEIDGILRIAVRGPLTIATARSFRRAYEGRSPSRVILDLRRIETLCMQGIGMVLILAEHARDHRAAFDLRVASPPVRRLLEAAGVAFEADEGDEITER